MPDEHCLKCVYYQGNSDTDVCCCYIFIEDRKRPCPPGKYCTVMKPRKRVRSSKGDRHYERSENE